MLPKPHKLSCSPAVLQCLSWGPVVTRGSMWGKSYCETGLTLSAAPICPILPMSLLLLLLFSMPESSSSLPSPVCLANSYSFLNAHSPTLFAVRASRLTDLLRPATTMVVKNNSLHFLRTCNVPVPGMNQCLYAFLYTKSSEYRNHSTEKWSAQFSPSTLCHFSHVSLYPLTFEGKNRVAHFLVSSDPCTSWTLTGCVINIPWRVG